MKKVLLMLALMIGAVTMMAQEDRDESVEIDTTTIPYLNELALTDSLLLDVNAWLEHIEINLSLKNRYKLYPTDNMYTFLRLDTKTGMIDKIQWSLDTNKEFIVSINSTDLTYGNGYGSGTFELYPTQNMYQFLLIDKTDGRTWHVQWGMNSSERWIRRIYY
jgi:hypothetical protein